MSVEFHIRVDETTHDDFIRRIESLGFKSINQAINVLIETVTYDGQRKPMENMLTMQLNRLQGTMRPLEDIKKLHDDFVVFMESYEYAARSVRWTEEEFYKSEHLDQSDSLFYQRFYHLHKYALIPVEAEELLHYYYTDAVARKFRQNNANAQMKRVTEEENENLESLLTIEEIKNLNKYKEQNQPSRIDSI